MEELCKQELRDIVGELDVKTKTIDIYCEDYGCAMPVEVLSVFDASRLFGVPERTLQTYLELGFIPGKKIGGEWKIYAAWPKTSLKATTVWLEHFGSLSVPHLKKWITPLKWTSMFVGAAFDKALLKQGDDYGPYTGFNLIDKNIKPELIANLVGGGDVKQAESQSLKHPLAIDRQSLIDAVLSGLVLDTIYDCLYHQGYQSLSSHADEWNINETVLLQGAQEGRFHAEWIIGYGWFAERAEVGMYVNKLQNRVLKVAVDQ